MMQFAELENKDTLKKELGEFVRTMRNKLGLTQTDLAKKVKVSQVYICTIETGLQIPTNAMLMKIADALKDAGVTYQELLFRAEYIQNPKKALTSTHSKDSIAGNLSVQITNEKLRESVQKLETLAARGILNETQIESIAERFLLEIQFLRAKDLAVSVRGGSD